MRPGVHLSGVFAMNTDLKYWEIFSSISTALGAFATFWAAYIALQIAQRQSTPQLRIRFGWFDRIGMARAIALHAVNEGLVPVTIYGMVFKIGKIRLGAMVPDITKFNKPLPANLQHGEAFQAVYTKDEFVKFVVPAIAAALKDHRIPAIALHYSKVGLALSVGEEKYVRLPKGVRKLICDIIAEKSF